MNEAGAVAVDFDKGGYELVVGDADLQAAGEEKCKVTIEAGRWPVS